MFGFIVIFLALVSSNLAFAHPGKVVELELLPRRSWDTKLRRDSVNQSLALKDHERFMWTSPKNSSKNTVVSMVLTTKPSEQLVIDMEHFYHTLAAVNCSGGMMLQFRYNWTYNLAMMSWNWVNFNSIRTFIMVPNHRLCGDDRSLKPWLVSDVRYEPSNLTMYLNATQKHWRQVGRLYSMDFGDFAPRVPWNTHHKRFLDFSLDQSFTLNLNAQIPNTTVNLTSGDNWALQASVLNSGTKGTLVFAGHVEASPFSGVEKFEVSVTPHGIEADLNLALGFQGEKNFGNNPFTKEVTLASTETPVGIRISGLLDFGLTGQINAGFALHYLEGKAKIGTGIIAKIPDNAVAKVDLTAKDVVQISGWTPQFQTLPLTIQAQIDAKAEVFLEAAISAAATVLDEDGVNVDVALRLPDVTIQATAGYNSAGFCPNNPSPFGVELQASIGADLRLDGWDEVNGKKNIFLSEHLFYQPDVFTFPPVCLAFGSGTPGSCNVVPQSAIDSEYLDNEVFGGLTKRSLRAPLRPDAKRSYYLTCDANKEHRIALQQYFAPARIFRNGGTPPVINPLIPCGAVECDPDTWKLGPNLPPAASSIQSGRWAADHIYEAVWVRNYMDYIKNNYFTSSDGCSKTLDAFGFKPITIATPDPQGPTNYSEALMQNLGTEYTYNDRMAILPQKQNELKNRMFAGIDIDASIMSTTDDDKNPNSNKERACNIGRIITTCLYMNQPDVQARLKTTIVELEKVLTVMDGNSAVKLPSGTYAAAHRTFFDNLYQSGIQHTRERLATYAKYILGRSDADQLDAKTLEALRNITADPAKYCPNDYSHP